jgi:hypothetical protein
VSARCIPKGWGVSRHAAPPPEPRGRDQYASTGPTCTNTHHPRFYFKKISAVADGADRARPEFLGWDPKGHPTSGSATAWRGSGAGPHVKVDVVYSVGFLGGPPTIPRPLPANSLVRSKIRTLDDLGVDGFGSFSAIPVSEELALLGSSEGVDAMLLCR